MASITIDDELATQLEESSEQIEFKDSEGNVVGYFQSVRLREMYAKAMAHFDIEESRRRRESGKPTYTMEQIREHLDALGSESCVSP